MAQKYFNVKGAAEAIGITEAEVKQLLETRELHGYRDGTDWKFKSEDINRLAAQHKSTAPAAPPADEGEADVLLSEVELGQSDPGLSGTVIGADKGKIAKEKESAAKLAESDIKLGDEPRAPAGAHGDVATKVSQFEELDLTLDQDLTLEDSVVASTPAAPAKPAKGDSAVDLSGKKLEDDDLVLGGGATGSDISIGGDSGISLVDPADSGLSLDAPLNLAAPAEESLELGEDDLLSFSSDTGSGLKSEDDFQLTPMEEIADGDDSESGSQVIALDTEGEGDDAATMIASGSTSMSSMLDDDLGAMPLVAGAGAAMSPGLGGAALASQDALALESAAIALPEAPYSILNIVGLVICSLLLILVGMMMYDLLRNMWSWDKVHPVNSYLMDTILHWFEK